METCITISTTGELTSFNQDNVVLLQCDFKIDIIGNRTYYENYTENYRINTVAGEYEYESLTPNTFGNFNISTILIKIASLAITTALESLFWMWAAEYMHTAGRTADSDADQCISRTFRVFDTFLMNCNFGF